MLRRGQTVRTTVALLEHMKKESRNSDISMLLLAARMRLNLSSCCNARLGRESPVDHLPYNLLEEVGRRLSFELYKDLLRRQFAMLKMEPGANGSNGIADGLRLRYYELETELNMLSRCQSRDERLLKLDSRITCLAGEAKQLRALQQRWHQCVWLEGESVPWNVPPGFTETRVFFSETATSCTPRLQHTPDGMRGQGDRFMQALPRSQQSGNCSCVVEARRASWPDK
jgi:hypothetical protein